MEKLEVVELLVTSIQALNSRKENCRHAYALG